MSFFESPRITDKQKEYIKILSSYPSTKNQDEADIKSFLKRVNKSEVTLLSKKEASELIQILLKRLAEYTFPCGKKATLNKKEINCYNVLGKLEGCLHSCPDNIDVNSCEYWEKYEGEQEETEE